ncbi:MAG: UvrB/UvrC motif-containing protein [Clostridia bacterium]|nr:UvrB/UvrC motif-containing protein [Clostridia bacterium]
MKCESCKQKEATFFYEENVNGQARSLHLCADCAAKLQADGKLFSEHAEGFPFPSFTQLHNNFLDGLFGIAASPVTKESKNTCPGCGATWGDLMKDGKAFCPQCYTTFGEELEPTLRSLHGHVTHTGRAPAGRRAQREKRDRLASLKTQLANAIKEEKFEDAAKLRDEIRTLEKE